MKRSLFLFLLVQAFFISLHAQECNPDVKAPSIGCVAGLEISINDINQDGTFAEGIWALDFIVSDLTSDNCSTNLSYRIEIYNQTPAGDVPQAEAIELTEENVGYNAVRVWAGDEAGNWDFCETFVNVENGANCETDNLAPVAKCKTALDVTLDASSGNVVVLPDSLDAGSVDNCTIALTKGLSLGGSGDNPLPSLSFSAVGTHLVSLTIADQRNNRAHCQAYINVFDEMGNGPECSEDNVPPIALCSEDQVFTITTVSNPLSLSGDFMGLKSYDNCSDLSFRIELGAASNEPPSSSSLTFDETEFGIELVTVWAIDEAGNSSHCTVEVNVMHDFTQHHFSGTVFVDEGNCEMEQAGQAISGVDVKVSLKVNGTTRLSRIFPTFGDIQARYSAFIKEYTPTRIGFGTGDNAIDYEEGDQIDVEVILWENINTSCTNSIVFEDITAGENNSFNQQDFGVGVASPCPELYVDLATPFLRRCFENDYWINYCNYGGLSAKETEVTVTFDDYLEIVGSSIPWTSVDGQTYTFSVGEVPSGDCGRFSVKVLVKCEAVLGQTHCSEASISHSNTCESNAYQGPELELKVDCEGDNVKFRIRNIGQDMEQGHHYIVIEDILMMDGGQTLTLLNGEEQVFNLPANGATFRLEVDQDMNYPWAKTSGLSLEGCGENANGDFSRGFVTQYGESDWRPEISIDCQENRGAFDPNDKQAFPTGVGADKLTAANTNLEYMIRFQNTGTDTAFTVRIEDQLSELLDITTVKPGASSHPYSFSIDEDRKMQFRFNDILLPDSTTNEPASHGFVKFSVDQIVDNPIGSLIENTAGIYFDFNEPIITNMVIHLIGENVLSSNREIVDSGVETRVIPNPFNKSAVLSIENTSATNLEVQLFDYMGRWVRTETIQSNHHTLHRKSLSNGIYYYRVASKSGILSSGKLILN